jgi:membrane glycosyltransferase
MNAAAAAPAVAIDYGSACVPPSAPLAMPAQSLRRYRRSGRVRWSFVAWLARLLTFGGAAALTAAGAREMYGVVHIGGITPLEWVMVGLFAITFGWIALSAAACVTGILLGWQRRRAPKDAPLTTRTALVMPVYNESPAPTFAALQAMAESLVEEGHGRAFELFILSDTTNADIWVAETAAFRRLSEAVNGAMPVWYRRRYENTARKAGNVQDFVERWGARYDWMVVLDADSMMSTPTLVTLVREMQADPRLGILQTVPTLANGQGLLPRLQQFANRVYGPIVARGLAAWQGPDGNYWGHNAIIRMHAFAESCGLPPLRGVKPFGGAILSHDFVEAAFIRRAGWSVRLLSSLEGSWEEGPPSLLDAAARDRRWAQGNLQHLAVVPARGLKLASRLHLLMGVMSYLASPLWLLLIIIGLTLTLQAALIRPEYFTADFQLFPSWPRFDPERMIRLFVITMGVLLLPKAVGLLRAFLVRGLRGPVGIIRLVLGAAMELILSALYAPIMMIIQCRQLWEILRGRDSGWSTQRRGDGTTPWGEIVRRHWLQTLIGVALGGALY